MSYLKTILVMTLLLALSACQSSVPRPDHLTVHQRYEAACVGAGEAYGVIAAANNLHPLKAAQQAQVLKAVAITDARCKLKPGEDYPYTATEAAMVELEGAAATLNTIKGEVR